jgi:SulP family sulfate permease
MGTLVNFISHTVVIGFTAGAAILIASSQVKHFFGIDIPRGVPFYEVLHQLALQFDDINLYVTAVGIITLVSGLLVKRFLPQIPYMIAAMIVGSVAAMALSNAFGPDATQIAKVGALTANLPPLSLPDFSLKAIHDMFFPALVVTMLALTEAVSISRSIALKSEQRIDGNQEFVGQGLSNILGSFFSGYASSGSFNRSGVNFSSGARTPLAAVFASVFLVLILLLVAPLAAYLPTAAMAGILFLVAWGLIDFHHIADIIKTNRQEMVVLIVTFVGTLINLEKGIFIGIILSLVFYLYRTSRPLIRSVVPDPNTLKRKFAPSSAAGLQECPQLKMLRVYGSIFFGAVDHVKQTLHGVQEENPGQKNTLIFSNGINFIDVAGAEMLVQEARRHRKLGGNLYLCGVKEGFCGTLRQGGYLNEIGRENLFPSKSAAIEGIYPQLDTEICHTCQARIFSECQSRLPNGEPR